MPKIHCVCSLINKLTLLGVHNLEGEIYFKHSAKCKAKITGSFEWTGTGYERRDE